MFPTADADSELEGIPDTVPLCATTTHAKRVRRRTAPLRMVLLLAVAVLAALVAVRAAVRFHSEYNQLAEVRREGSIYWHTVCDEGRRRLPNSYDQCTRARTAAHQFTSVLALERVLHLALQDLNPFADCVPGTSCSFVWMKASEAAIRLIDAVASNLTLALGLLSYAVYSNAAPLLVAWLKSFKRRRQSPPSPPALKKN